jgi:hypothetical protein
MKILDINSDWTKWSSEKWLEAFPILESTLPGFNIVKSSRSKFMTFDKSPSETQIKLMKDYYSNKVADKIEEESQLQESIERTKIYMEESKRIFEGDLAPIKDWIDTFECAVAMTDFVPTKDDLLSYFFKKKQLGYNVSVSSKLQDDFYSKYGSEITNKLPIDKILPSEREAMFERIFD